MNHNIVFSPRTSKIPSRIVESQPSRQKGMRFANSLGIYSREIHFSSNFCTLNYYLLATWRSIQLHSNGYPHSQKTFSRDNDFMKAFSFLFHCWLFTDSRWGNFECFFHSALFSVFIPVFMLRLQCASFSCKGMPMNEQELHRCRISSNPWQQHQSLAIFND